ncbi:MAG: hypothetical protein ACE5NP_12510, partial [Anaerolineae bacterium]
GTLKQAHDPYVYLHRKLGTIEQSQEFFQKGLTGQIDIVNSSSKIFILFWTALRPTIPPCCPRGLL